MDLFDDIRPYNNEEATDAMLRLVQNKNFLNLLISKKLSINNSPFTYCYYYFSRLFVRYKLTKLLSNIESIEDFQEEISKRLQYSLDKTTDGYEFVGLDNLKANCSYLFLSNHRDIALDPALVNLGMRQAKRDTVRIAIGDNLLSRQYAIDLMRINKSFIVKRSFENRRQKLEFLKRLSSYIQQSLTVDKSSVWIAQAEGRAKNGKDLTDTALLKMLCLAKAKGEQFSEFIQKLNVIPVAISYEYDPCIRQKVDEIHAKRNGLEYKKSKFEDLDSIVKGFLDYKGRVKVTFGHMISQNSDSVEDLAKEVDKQIHNNYCLFPSNIIAWALSNPDEQKVIDKLKKLWPRENWNYSEEKFLVHLKDFSGDLREIAVGIYAEPVTSRLMYK